MLTGIEIEVEVAMVDGYANTCIRGTYNYREYTVSIFLINLFHESSLHN